MARHQFDGRLPTSGGSCRSRSATSRRSRGRPSLDDLLPCTSAHLWIEIQEPFPSRQVTSSTGAMCSGSRLLLQLRSTSGVSGRRSTARAHLPQPGRRVAPPCTHRIISGTGCMLGGRRPGRNGRCQSSRLAGWCPRPVRPWKARGRRDRDGGVSLRSRIRRPASMLRWFRKRAADLANSMAGVIEVVRRSKRPRCSCE